MQRAIRARALQTIENDEQTRAVLSPRRKFLLTFLSLVTVIGLVFIINWGVAIMQRIFELWQQDDAPLVVPKPSDTFYINVNPEQPVPAVDDGMAPSK